jgi:hypothetical protein
VYTGYPRVETGRLHAAGGGHARRSRIRALIEDDEELVFREYCGELEQAKRRGQRLADTEGLPALIFTIEGYRDIAELSPRICSRSGAGRLTDSGRLREPHAVHREL